MEERIVANSKLRFAGISAGKFRRDQSRTATKLGKVLNPQTLGPNVRDAGRVVAGLSQSLKLLRDYKPAVVFCKGGYVALPVGLAARMLRIPLVIHESDVSPGLTTRVLGRWADKIAVGFPVKSYRELDRERLVFTGNPVRTDRLSAHRLEGLKKFELSDDLPVVLVTGGSLGAGQINDAVVGALPELLQSVQVIHLTGEGEYERVMFEVKRRGSMEHFDRYHAYGFLMAEMPLALAAADMVLARAGANNIAEFAALGKPTVLIPNYHMAGHQLENARVLSRAGAARVLDGSKLTPASLVGEVKRLVGDSEEQERLSRAIRQFAVPDAPERLAEVILAAGRAGERGEVQKPNTEGEA